MTKSVLLAIVFPTSVVLTGLGACVAMRLSPYKAVPIRSLWEYVMRVYGFYRDDVSDADRLSSIKHERVWIIAAVVTFVVSLYSLIGLAWLLGLTEQ